MIVADQDPASRNRMDLVSVVIPVYVSEHGLRPLYERLKATLEGLRCEWETIMVDDGSHDGSFRMMQELRAADPRVKIIQLAYNHGQQRATLCGLCHANGDRVITLDDDLQNPPEEIPKFLAALEQGYDVVIGRIKGAKRHSLLRNLGSAIKQYLNERILGKPRDIYLSSYRAFSRKAVDAMIVYRGSYPYIPALIFRTMHPSAIVNVEVRHEPRRHGRSRYSWLGLLRLTSYLLINHSAIPLRLMAVWGFFLSFVSVLFAVLVAVRSLFYDHSVVGWPSLAVLVSFLSGNILLGLGIAGEYIGRILRELSSTQQFAIFRKDP
jgi:glycosyltransferase involved in cell wall biosynthesis